MKHLKCLCGKKDVISPLHILNDCTVVAEWEREIINIGINKKEKVLHRGERKIFQYEWKNDLFDYCWIVNWSLWNTFWKVFYKSEIEPLKSLFGFLEVNEKAYIELNKVNVQNSKSLYKKFTERTKLFRYHSFDD